MVEIVRVDGALYDPIHLRNHAPESTLSSGTIPLDPGMVEIDISLAFTYRSNLVAGERNYTCEATVVAPVAVGKVYSVVAVFVESPKRFYATIVEDPDDRIEGLIADPFALGDLTAGDWKSTPATSIRSRDQYKESLVNDAQYENAARGNSPSPMSKKGGGN